MTYPWIRAFFCFLFSLGFPIEGEEWWPPVTNEEEESEGKRERRREGRFNIICKVIIFHYSPSFLPSTIAVISLTSDGPSLLYRIHLPSLHFLLFRGSLMHSRSLHLQSLVLQSEPSLSICNVHHSSGLRDRHVSGRWMLVQLVQITRQFEKSTRGTTTVNKR